VLQDPDWWQLLEIYISNCHYALRNHFTYWCVFSWKISLIRQMPKYTTPHMKLQNKCLTIGDRIPPNPGSLSRRQQYKPFSQNQAKPYAIWVSWPDPAHAESSWKLEPVKRWKSPWALTEHAKLSNPTPTVPKQSQIATPLAMLAARVRPLCTAAPWLIPVESQVRYLKPLSEYYTSRLAPVKVQGKMERKKNKAQHPCPQVKPIYVQC